MLVNEKGQERWTDILGLGKSMPKSHHFTSFNLLHSRISYTCPCLVTAGAQPRPCVACWTIRWSVERDFICFLFKTEESFQSASSALSSSKPNGVFHTIFTRNWIKSLVSLDCALLSNISRRERKKLSSVGPQWCSGQHTLDIVMLIMMMSYFAVLVTTTRCINWPDWRDYKCN